VSAARVLQVLRDSLALRDLLKPQAVLLAAVSGGSDSMALLYGLHLLQKETGFSLNACHVQHGLRGADSLADEQLVRECCARWEIPLTVHTAQLGGDIHLPGMETRARESRRKFFSETMRQLGAQALLLAHHQDDQTETVLMHLLRGAGGNGLSGMQEAVPCTGGSMLRPLLGLSKTDLRNALTEWKVPYREDGSNREALTPRNALRLQVLPLLEELYPGCTAHMAHTARLLRRDEDALERQAIRLVHENTLYVPGLHAVRTDALRQAHEAIAIRALRLWYAEGLRRAQINPDERQLSAEVSDKLLTFALLGGRDMSDSSQSASVLNLPHQLRAFMGSCWLHLQRQDGSPLCGMHQQETPLSELMNPAVSTLPVGEAPLPGWCGDGASSRLTMTLSAATPELPPQTAMTAYVPLEWLSRCVLRTPCPGDQIHPLGAPGSKPLRRWLTDRKIDAPFRPLLPVVAQDDTILWIPGLCTSQQLAVTPGQPCLCLILTAEPPYLPITTRKGD